MEGLDGSGRRMSPRRADHPGSFLMSLLDTTQQALESAMSGAELRNTLLTNNLANASTPGYQPEDVNFQSTLQSAIASGQSPTSANFQPYTVQQATGPDGNG